MGDIVRTAAFCTQCRSRCGCEAVVEDGRLARIEPLRGHPTGEKLCPKGLAAPELVYHPDRLTKPLRRTAPKDANDPGWTEITWDAALDEIAGHMSRIAREHGPEQVAFSVTTPSGSHISDSISWIERFIRAFGSPNTIYGTEICNWHKDFATRFTFGTDIGTPDFAGTDCILLWGHNPTATWLARLVEVQAALKRGARMIVVDPRPTVLTRRADAWLQVRPGTDQVLALGLINRMIESGRFDADTASGWTNGPLLVRDDTDRFLRESDVVAGGSPDVLLADGGDRLLAWDVQRGIWREPDRKPVLRAARAVTTPDGPVFCRSAFARLADAAATATPPRVEAITGIPAEAMDRALDVLAGAKSVAYYAWNGVGQSTNATQTDRAISILYALTGSYGRAGGNVPGAAAPFVDISGQDLLSPDQRRRALGLAERPLGPGLHGWVTARDVYRAAIERAPYPVRMLFSFGTNLLVSQPDADLARAAFHRLDFHVHADMFLNATASHADIVLPVATSWEREGLRTGFDASLRGLKRVQLRPPVIAPVGEARSDTDIVLGLSRRLGLGDMMFGCDADRGHDVVLAPAGLSVAHLRERPEGVEVAGVVRLDAHRVTTADGAPRGFPTPTKRIELYSERLAAHGIDPVPTMPGMEADGSNALLPLVLSGAKVVAYCHSQHRNIPSLRKLVPDPLIEMAPADAAARGIAQGDWVRVRTAKGTAVARASLVAGLAPGTVFGQHGWWVEGAADSPYGPGHALAASINAAIDTSMADPVSGSIPLRRSPCEVERV
jgi:anaerobic selenocysteine-containing dehydrogenase